MRSLLFIPADSERKLERGTASGADCLIIDLEDSVSAANKPEARKRLKNSVAAARAVSKARVFVRINDLSTAFWQEDAAAVREARPDGVMLPKPRSGEDVHKISITLSGGAAKDPAILILPIVTELPISLLQMQTYVGASESLCGLTWGAEDLSAELGSLATRDASGQFTTPFVLARNLTLYTAAAAGLPAFDTVFVAFRDPQGLERECAEAARDGFSGKMAIHPDQVEIINRAFTPSAKDIEKAKVVIETIKNAVGGGVASREGEMLDLPHLKRAERLLARAKAAGLV